VDRPAAGCVLAFAHHAHTAATFRPGHFLVKWLTAVATAVVLAVLLDRLLLRMEARGWIFYRRTRGVRGGAMYHAQELDSIFNPGMQHVQEAHVKQEQEEDESGDPPVVDSMEDR
jgi:hypothetical protein